MSGLEVQHLSGIRKSIVIIGIGFLCISVLMFMGVLLGIVEFDQFELLGHSGLRTIAAIAVSGCLLAAIGFNNQ